jgi:hypothetical protein
LRKSYVKSPFVPDFDDMVLAFLNEGGDYHNVQKELQEFNEGSQLGLSFLPLERDITNDSIPELIFRDYSGFPIVHIFSCVKGKYVDFTPLTAANTALPVVFENITDLNTNGIPEILLSSKNWIGIYEWDGYDFILLNPGMGEGGEMYYEFLDSDNNQTKNVVLKRGYPHDECLEFPWRRYQVTYSWNGYIFAENSREFHPPEYRFQAIQDADRYSASHIFDKAMLFYQEAIFNNKLEWYSQEKRKYFETLAGFYGRDVTPQPLTPDITEYPRLAAYAYYRVILLHLAQGQEAEAASAYKTLQETFGNDPYAAPYVEMASAFWEAYQSTRKMYDGCAAAIQYAVEHSEILIPLGSDYHGWQSHIYEPADVCPFR